MGYGEPLGWRQAAGHRPIWIDPNFYRYPGYGTGGWVTTETTNVTRPYRPPTHQPVDEERIRKIVREEISKLPISFDVPDSLPEE